MYIFLKSCPDCHIEEKTGVDRQSRMTKDQDQDIGAIKQEQTVMWARMDMAYVERVSAVETLLDGNHQASLCELIQWVRDAQDECQTFRFMNRDILHQVRKYWNKIRCGAVW